MADNVTVKRKDSRIAKTDRDIKRAMLSLIAKEPFSHIRIEEIMSEAPVTKVTFYRHFASKDAVLDAIKDDIVKEMESALDGMPERSLARGILIYFELMERPDAAYHRLFWDEDYAGFRQKLREEYFSSDFFKGMCKDKAFAGIASAYIADAAEGIYRNWRKHSGENNRSLEELAGAAGRLLTAGLNGIS